MKKFVLFTASMLLSMLLILPSCTKDEDEEPEVTTGVNISGQILNVTATGVRGAVVNFASATRNFSATTDDEGNYTITGINEGSYTVSIEAAGYNTSTESNITVSSGSVHNFDVLGNASVTGKVLNSQTGLGVANAEIAFYALDKKSTDDFIYVVFKLYSNAEGIYHLGDLPEGFFNVRMSAPGFNNNDLLNVQLIGGENSMGESTVVEQVSEGDVRIVLSWGEYPYDLDTHITGPTSNGDRFHVYYVTQSVDNGTVAYLDVDDTESYGPETVTISQYMSGVYRYSVHNYTDSSIEGGAGIYNSPTKVEIFDSNGLIATFTPKPFAAGSGNTWRVFEFSINNDVVSITTIDEYIHAESEDDIDNFKSNQFKPESIFNLSDF
jgi:hypothetical protein